MSDVTTRRKRRVARLAALAGVAAFLSSAMPRVGGVSPRVVFVRGDDARSYRVILHVPDARGANRSGNAHHQVPRYAKRAFHIRVRHARLAERGVERAGAVPAPRVFISVQAKKRLRVAFVAPRAPRRRPRAGRDVRDDDLRVRLRDPRKRFALPQARLPVPGKRRGVEPPPRRRSPRSGASPAAPTRSRRSNTRARAGSSPRPRSPRSSPRAGIEPGTVEGGCAGTARGQSGTSPRGGRSPRRERLVALFPSRAALFRRARVRRRRRRRASSQTRWCSARRCASPRGRRPSGTRTRWTNPRGRKSEDGR